MKALKVLGTVLIGSALLASSVAFARDKGRGGENAPVVFVTSQGLYYDSIVVVESLPAKGEFQQLIPSDHGLMTEYGPGEVGHLGGRWWIDVDGDGTMNDGDKFFLCPLLGPGRDMM